MRTPLVPSILLLVALGAMAAAPAVAREPRGVDPGPARGRFLGAHPVAARLGGGYCYIDVPHLHAYLPDRPALYQQVGDGYLFTGDPVPFGYDGPRTVFYGAHPVQVRLEGQPPAAPIFCGIRGPHYHDYVAPPVPDYKVQDGVVFYVGPLAPEYARQRPRIERALEDEYRPFVALRPEVRVAPPPEWQGELWVAPPAPPVVHVAPPAPVVVASPRIRFEAPSPTVIVTPPAPPGVFITAPSPPGVFITAPAAPGVILAPGFYGHPGKHKGWYKGKGGHKGRRGGWDE